MIEITEQDRQDVLDALDAIKDEIREGDPAHAYDHAERARIRVQNWGRGDDAEVSES